MINIPTKDLERFISCLNLTQSDTDGEALAAVRGANRIFAEYNQTWSAALHELEGRVRKAIREHRPTISQALDELLRVLSPSDFRKLIVQFQERWNTKRMLSDKQRGVIRNALVRNNVYLDWTLTDFAD
jgi:restriction endonuclease Mrr